MKGSPAKTALRKIAENRQARFFYEVEESLEAGVELLGSEIKSLREGKVSLAEGYAAPRGQELYLYKIHIAPYKPAGLFGHEPLRPRRLLLHRREIEKLSSKVRERGLALIPLSLYFKEGWAKVQLGLCYGKKQADRRESVKERQVQREIAVALRRR
ncbi:MAG: SsrA-binding protein SmpB [Proteobacteria bacterium]|nr:SsrA-binding protein SmpB [Cystobacterineae bacterium]MCL2314713.1 SsrA-binding protein SmpB [Pseudomonadota bacterium]